MKILILGGTGFIGRHVVETLLANGHALTVLSRGRTKNELPGQVECLHGDRSAGIAALQPLQGRAWDVCIDISGYTAAQVRASAQTLRASVSHYVYVSAVSVYGDPQLRPVLESHPRILPATEDVLEVNGQTYGALKVACEDIVQEVFADGCSILRPQVVVGPHDPSGRYAHWIQRAAQPGEMLAPGDGADHLQVIDVRDLAGFVRIVTERGVPGSFNLAGRRIAWSEFMTILCPRDPVWVPAEVLESAGLTFVELPLFRAEHGPRSGLMHVSNERAVSAGLTLTDPELTARDVRAWVAGTAFTPALALQREADLIRRARMGPSV